MIQINKEGVNFPQILNIEEDRAIELVTEFNKYVTGVAENDGEFVILNMAEEALRICKTDEEFCLLMVTSGRVLGIIEQSQKE